MRHPQRGFRQGLLSSQLPLVAMLSGCADEPDATSRASGVSAPESAIVVTMVPDEQARIATTLDQLATDLGPGAHPEVAIERVISQADGVQVLADCLTAEGFSEGFPGEGDPRWPRLRGRQARFPIDPNQDETSLSVAQKKVAFDYLTVTLVNCLEGHGGQFGSPRSEVTFVPGFDESAPWNPYTTIRANGAFSAQESDQLQTDCAPDTP